MDGINTISLNYSMITLTDHNQIVQIVLEAHINVKSLYEIMIYIH